jgi:hypothetical protein
LPPAQQRDLGVGEVSKVTDQQVKLQPLTVQWRSRPIWIDRGCPSAHRRAAWSRPTPWSASQTTDRPRSQTPRRPSGAKRFAQILSLRRARGGIELWQGSALLLQTAPTCPIGRREPVCLGADAWLPRPQGGAAKPHPVRHYSDPNRIQRVYGSVFGYAQIRFRLSLVTATAQAHKQRTRPPVSSTAVSTATRARR